MHSRSVLCHDLNVSLWEDLAYVGGVWPKLANEMFPFPVEGMCKHMENKWKSWTHPQVIWEKQAWENHGIKNGENLKSATRAKTMVNVKFSSEFCSGDGIGPVGSGGLSLRSRKWAIKAIETCPHVKLSSIDLYGKQYPCKVIDEVKEDVYFSTVLTGMRAPLPSTFEASLFVSEMLWPEEVENQYYNLKLTSRENIEAFTSNDYRTLSISEKERIVEYRWGGQDQLSHYRKMHDSYNYVAGSTQLYTIPIGLNKVWWHQPNEILLGDQVQRECKFLKYVFSPSQTKWKKPSKKMQWRGIGK